MISRGAERCQTPAKKLGNGHRVPQLTSGRGRGILCPHKLEREKLRRLIRLAGPAVILCLVSLQVGAGPLSGEGRPPRIIPLPEIETVFYVRAEHGRVYIQDKKDIAVHAFDDGRFLRRIGRPGQGPGEFTLIAGFTVLEDRIVVADISKMLYFTIEGEYIEQVIPPVRQTGYPILPVGKHFVGVPWERREDGSPLPRMGVIYDQAGKPVKRFIEVPDVLPPPPPPPGSSPSSGKTDVLMINDYFDYIVHGDRIFVADSRRGLSISVFDQTGALLYEIQHALDRVIVSKEYREFAVKSRPDKYWASHRPVFPKYFPAFAAFKIDGGRIYAVTGAVKDGRYEVIVMDLEGKIVERGFRFPIQVDFRVPLVFARTFDVEEGRFVWVEYNDAKERYELHID
jgi:hypothetical protein